MVVRGRRGEPTGLEASRSGSFSTLREGLAGKAGYRTQQRETRRATCSRVAPALSSSRTTHVLGRNAQNEYRLSHGKVHVSRDFGEV